MGADPWNRNEGRYDQPSSGMPRTKAVPASRPVPPERPSAAPAPPRPRPVDRATFVDRMLEQAVHDGVVASDSATICARIDAAMARLVEMGHGTATSIYLTDSDLLALREATGTIVEYRDLRIDRGATSKAYSKRGSVAVRKRASGPGNPPLFAGQTA